MTTFSAIKSRSCSLVMCLDLIFFKLWLTVENRFWWIPGHSFCTYIILLRVYFMSVSGYIKRRFLVWITVRHYMCYGIKILRIDEVPFLLTLFKASGNNWFGFMVLITCVENGAEQRTRMLSLNVIGPHWRMTHQQSDLQVSLGWVLSVRIWFTPSGLEKLRASPCVTASSILHACLLLLSFFSFPCQLPLALNHSLI